MKRTELNGKSICILGYGKEGRASEAFLKKIAPQARISVLDKSIDPDYLKKQEGFDLIIKTPGIPKRYIKGSYTTATNLFFEYCPGIIIGVTGTKGKSTTSSLIYHILQTSGKKVHLVGNIGTPALMSLLGSVTQEDIFVMELSSYQLDDLHYSPHIALVLNLFPEHMNYHGNVDAYYEAKKQIITHLKPDDYFIYHPQYEKLREWGITLSCQKIPYIPTPVPVCTQELPLIGRHNKDNIQAAIRVAKVLSIPDSDIMKAIRSFKPLPHRLENIGEYHGVIFYDDAISTTPESTEVAIRTLKQVDTIFLGGENRGYDFRELAHTIQKHNIKNLVFFPDTGLIIQKLLIQNGYSYSHSLVTRDMKEAVNFAFAHTRQGRICLLSTASPSYSIWKNFEEKGDLFKQYVRNYKKA